MKPTLAQQSAAIAFSMFFASIKALLIMLILVVAVLVAGQSRVAPVSVNLLTHYAMEGAVSLFKPVRPYFPEPYLIHVDKTQRGSYVRH